MHVRFSIGIGAHDAQKYGSCRQLIRVSHSAAAVASFTTDTQLQERQPGLHCIVHPQMTILFDTPHLVPDLSSYLFLL